MPKRKLTCHCGGVEAQVEMPDKGFKKIMRCNCSICKRKGYIIGVAGPKDFQINVGIGVHMAEVYEEGGDLFGDGINLAARIKSVASGNEIFTTQAVYNSIRSEKNIYVKDVGRVVLKNIKDPEQIEKAIKTENGERLENHPKQLKN